MSDKPLAGSLKAGTWLHKAGVYARLMRLDKPIGTLLLLWPTLWALWLAAQGRPDNTVLLCFALGTLLMRSAGCVINDWADRDFDGSVARTAGRPFSRGEVAEKEALRLAAVLVLLAACCLIPLNRTVWLFALPALFVAFSYPFAKRFFPLPQLYLGIAFSFGIPMAFAAVQGRVPGYAWWLFAANLCWTLAYDTIYAMADKEDDLKIGIKTSAITFGRLDAEMAMLCHGLLVPAGRFGRRWCCRFTGNGATICAFRGGIATSVLPFFSTTTKSAGCGLPRWRCSTASVLKDFLFSGCL